MWHRPGPTSYLYLVAFVLFSFVCALPAPPPDEVHVSSRSNRTVSVSLFRELEELSRLVGISYCVGYQGIQKPFKCLSHCSDFPGFELVQTWHTGIFEGNSCGYIVLSHAPWPRRIIVAFRGTTSLSNAIYDLQTAPAEYVPYEETAGRECDNCSVHSGFMRSWNATKAEILPAVKKAIKEHPGYRLVLAGHSLGGAIAGLAALDFRASGWHPEVTTFGEPRFGNAGLVKFVDETFAPNGSKGTYRRVTHVHDPVPFLPPKEWGWKPHAGEIYISKPFLPPAVPDLQVCEGDEDPLCIEGSLELSIDPAKAASISTAMATEVKRGIGGVQNLLGLPARRPVSHLLFAHREYFWRLGLCFDPQRGILDP